MSTSTARSNRPYKSLPGLPTGMALGCLLAGTITALLLSLLIGHLGWLFCTVIGVVALLVSLTVNARGLFLTVASFPLFFALGAVATSWALIQRQGGQPLSRTTIVTAIFPITQLFPWLAGLTIGCIIIAVVRYRLLRNRSIRLERAAARRRAHTAAADRTNRALSANARRRTNQVTVEELLSRNRKAEETPRQRPPRRSSHHHYER
ncbi:DUF6542 domain-containing protein [Corynebacterium tapiri]|uniref:DUF6542 domain-containing protein n=1 Tax=Corynebacterium tapiri TaxID=1448266 RepID=A0A5C4U7R2_9CORY|nr:DUF6542 domain-containing protein [Corynebacterium tapiri]TNM00513.1 hypothetical protein FHE74_00770 [Corynebacterium tapiri]